MTEDRITGQRAGIRWAIAWLRERAKLMGYASDRVMTRALAAEMVLAAERLRNDDADDITAGLEAPKEPIVAEWGEVKDRLNLGKED